MCTHRGTTKSLHQYVLYCYGSEYGSPVTGRTPNDIGRLGGLWVIKRDQNNDCTAFEGWEAIYHKVRITMAGHIICSMDEGASNAISDIVQQPAENISTQ